MSLFYDGDYHTHTHAHIYIYIYIYIYILNWFISIYKFNFYSLRSKFIKFIETKNNMQRLKHKFQYINKNSIYLYINKPKTRVEKLEVAFP